MLVQSVTAEYLLRIGDSCLILGHRLSEWTGHAPILEEELALANTALDLIGQARMWLNLAAEIEGAGLDEDKLAYGRNSDAYRNLLLVEQPNGDFAMTLTRQYLFDAWHVLYLKGLAVSADSRIAAIAGKAFKEASYHKERSRDWVVRLGDGTEESKRKMQAAVDELWYFTGEMFQVDDLEQEHVKSAVAVDSGSLHSAWLAQITATLAEAEIVQPAEGWMQSGSKQGVHSEHLSYLLAEMQSVHRAFPGCQW